MAFYFESSSPSNRSGAYRANGNESSQFEISSVTSFPAIGVQAICPRLGAENRSTAHRDANPDHVAIDETVIRINGQQFWLYTAVDPDTNGFLHVWLFTTTTVELT